MSDKKKKETQQPQEEPQEKEDSSVEENQPQEDPVEEKLRQAEEQVLALNAKLLRTLAEYDNFRKRSVKEKEAIYPEATADAISKFLPVLDSMEPVSYTHLDVYKRQVPTLSPICRYSGR